MDKIGDIVKSLTAKRDYKTDLLELLMTYLGRKGIQTELSEVPASTRLLDGGKTDTGIRLSGQDIDAIGVEEFSDSTYSAKKVRLRSKILLCGRLGKDSKRAVSAKTKVVKQGRMLGVFGGKVADVKWDGGRIADSLNRDIDLSRMLVHHAKEEGGCSIGIEPRESWVDIVCSDDFWLVEVLPEVLPLLESEGKNEEYGFWSLKSGAKLEADGKLSLRATQGLSALALHNRIAKHVRAVVGAH